MTKIKVTKKILRQVIIGAYTDFSTQQGVLHIDQMKEAVNFGNDIMKFLEKHKLLKDEIT
jgi:hypothetical protein